MTEERSRSRTRTNRREKEVDEGLTVDQIDFTDAKYHADIYFPEDFPDMKIPENLEVSDFPKFMRSILGAGYVSDFEKLVFMRKFAFLYLQSDFVKEHTNEWHFLFYKKKYLGAFKYPEDLNKYGYSQGYGFIHVPMYPRLIGSESKETSSVSNMITTYVQENGIQYPYYTHSKYKVNAKILVENDETKGDDIDNFYEINENQEYTVDTGCTVTNCPYQNYISSEYEYHEYPFDEYNEQQLIHRKNHLLYLNECIGQKEIITVKTSGDFTIDKILFVYKENTFLRINDGIIIKIDSASCDKLHQDLDKSLLENLLKKAVRSLSRNQEPVREFKEEYLMGLNCINQMQIEITPMRFNYNRMKFKHPKIYESSNPDLRRRDGKKSYYEIFTIQEGTTFYTNYYRTYGKTDEQMLNNLKYRDLIFCLNYKQLPSVSNHGDIFFEFVSDEKLILINLMHYTSNKETQEQIDKLKSFNEIDGFIVNEFVEPFSFRIKLLRYSFINKRIIDLPTINPDEKQYKINSENMELLDNSICDTNYINTYE